MVHLIDKDAVVAEIQRLHSAHSGKYGCDEVGINLEYLEDFLDTLDVKEVDLEKEIQNVIHNHFFDLNGIAVVGTSSYATVDDMVYIAKHFFELGLKTKQG